VIPAAVQQAAVDPRRVACRLLVAAAVRLWFLEGSFGRLSLRSRLCRRRSRRRLTDDGGLPSVAAAVSA